MKKKTADGVVAVLEEKPQPLEDLGEVELGLIEPDEDNTRGKLDRGELADLASSLKTHGLLNPLTVVKGGPKYVVLAGHRRLAAAKLLGWERIACRLYSAHVPLGGAAARIVENDQREALDPIAESRAVRDLAGGGMDPAEVGKLLGRSESWVRRRVGLFSLSPAAMKHEEVRSWPVAWIEDLAALPKALQEELLEDGRLLDCRTRKSLQETLFEHSSTLDGVPWMLDDVALVKKAGSCRACPKRSAHSPGLFDLIDRKDGSDHCLDRECFVGKHKAWREQAVRLAQEEHPGVLQVHGKSELNGSQVTAKGRALHRWEFATVKAGTKGAKPALVVDGSNAGKIVFVKPKPKPKSRGTSPSKKERPLAPEQVAELSVRARATADAVGILKGMKYPGPDAIALMISAYGGDSICERYVSRVRGRGDTRHSRLMRTPGPAWVEIWRDVVKGVVNYQLTVSEHWEVGSKRWAEEIEACAEEAELLCEFFDSRADRGSEPFRWKEMLEHARATEQKGKKSGSKK